MRVLWQQWVHHQVPPAQPLAKVQGLELTLHSQLTLAAVARVALRHLQLQTQQLETSFVEAALLEGSFWRDHPCAERSLPAWQQALQQPSPPSCRAAD